MKTRNSSSLNRVLGHLDNLDTTNLTILVQRLAKERELLEKVFNSIKDGILVLDHTGIIQYANQSSLELVGLSEQDIGETVLTDKWPDLNRWIDIQALDDPLETSTAVTREIEMTYPQQRFVRLFLMPLKLSTSSTRMSFLIVLTDITEQKETTLETIESEKIASIIMLAAGVAHEIGNPLNSLTIHLQLIERKLEQLEKSTATERIEKSIKVCEEEIKRLDGIITHFLGAIRDNPPDFQDVDLINVIEEVVGLQEESLQKNKIDLNVEIDLMKLVKDVEDRITGINLPRPIKVAILGCVVNGPGEASEADIGIAGGRGKGMLYKDGKLVRSFKEREIVDELVKELETFAEPA